MAKFVINFGDKYVRFHHRPFTLDDTCTFSFCAIYYIDATTIATIQSSFENIARNASAGTTIDDALHWLWQQRSEWLLLIDNADDPEINLQQFCPRCVHGNVLITTRNPHCRRYAPDSNVNVGGVIMTRISSSLPFRH
jgi:hypothetical protein